MKFNLLKFQYQDCYRRSLLHQCLHTIHLNLDKIPPSTYYLKLPLNFAYQLLDHISLTSFRRNNYKNHQNIARLRHKKTIRTGRPTNNPDQQFLTNRRIEMESKKSLRTVARGLGEFAEGIVRTINRARFLLLLLSVVPILLLFVGFCIGDETQLLDFKIGRKHFVSCRLVIVAEFYMWIS